MKTFKKILAVVFVIQSLMACSDAIIPGPGINPGDIIILPCDSDVNGDGVVNVVDLLDVLANWGDDPENPETDVNFDGVVDQEDLQMVLDNWAISNCQ